MRRKHRPMMTEQGADSQINRPIGLSYDGCDPSQRIQQVQVKNLACLGSSVKFLFAPPLSQNNGSIQLASAPQTVQPEQSDEANLPFANIQPGPGASVVKPDAVRMALKGAGCGIFVPQDKSRLPSMLKDNKVSQTESAQKAKFFQRKLRNIKANIDELHKKAGITTVALALFDGSLQFAGPDHMSKLVENVAFRDAFIEACLVVDEPVAIEADQINITSKKEEAPLLDWPCDDCDSSFPTEHTLINHKLLSHSGLPVHKCDLCDKEFVDITVLQKHLTTHAENSLFQCKMCGNAFAARNLLNSHMKVHNEEKAHSCKICLKSFHNSSSLQYHMHKHGSEKKCVCEYCKKEFTKMSSLKVHLRIHSGEQPFRCQECGKGFIVSTHLTRHLRVHSGEKPYLCEVCGKRFNRSSHLRIHYRIHSGEKPYECEICGKRFNQTVSRKKHLKTHAKK